MKASVLCWILLLRVFKLTEQMTLTHHRIDTTLGDDPLIIKNNTNIKFKMKKKN